MFDHLVKRIAEVTNTKEKTHEYDIIDTCVREAGKIAWMRYRNMMDKAQIYVQRELMKELQKL